MHLSNGAPADRCIFMEPGTTLAPMEKTEAGWINSKRVSTLDSDGKMKLDGLKIMARTTIRMVPCKLVIATWGGKLYWSAMMARMEET